jgi:hypothetical protein
LNLQNYWLNQQLALQSLLEKRLVPYIQLRMKKHRILKLKKEFIHHVGEGHTEEDKKLLLDDLIESISTNVLSEESTKCLIDNIRQLLDKMKPHSLARRIVGTQLTKGLPRVRASEISGLSIDVIDKTRQMLEKFDISLLKIDVHLNRFQFFNSNTS